MESAQEAQDHLFVTTTFSYFVGGVQHKSQAEILQVSDTQLDFNLGEFFLHADSYYKEKGLQAKNISNHLIKEETINLLVEIGTKRALVKMVYWISCFLLKQKQLRDEPIFRELLLSLIESEEDIIGEFLFIDKNYDMLYFNLKSGQSIIDLKEYLRSKKLEGELFKIGERKDSFIFICKFEFASNVTSSDGKFWSKYNWSKATTRFKEELLSEILDLHRMKCNTDKDPVHSMRVELWQRFSPYYVNFKQKTTHIEDLPDSVNPQTLKTISLDTINRAIQDMQI